VSSSRCGGGASFSTFVSVTTSVALSGVGAGPAHEAQKIVRQRKIEALLDFDGRMAAGLLELGVVGLLPGVEFGLGLRATPQGFCEGTDLGLQVGDGLLAGLVRLLRLPDAGVRHGCLRIGDVEGGLELSDSVGLLIPAEPDEGRDGDEA